MADHAFTAAATKHHTVWLATDEQSPTAHRFVVIDTRLVVADSVERPVPPVGAAVTATINTIASGPPIASHSARLESYPAEQLDDFALHELIGHRPLGSSAAEVAASLDRVRHSIRLAAIALP